MINSKISKIIVLLLASFLLASSITGLINVEEQVDASLDSVFEKDYLTSHEFRGEFYEITRTLVDLLKEYKGEEYIKSGELLDKHTQDPYGYSWTLKERYEHFKEDFYNGFDDEYEVEKYRPTEKELMNRFEREYINEIEKYRNESINEQLAEYYEKIEKIKSIKGLYYYMKSENEEYTNIENKDKTFFTKQPVYMVFDKNGYENNVHDFSTSDLSYYPQDIMYVGLNHEFIDPLMEKWTQDRKILISKLKSIALLLMGCIVSMGYLVYIIMKDNKVHLNILDKVYIDLHALGVGGVMLFCVIIVDQCGTEFEQMVLILSLISSIVFFEWILSLVKHIKNKSVIKHTACYWLLSKIFSFIDQGMKSMPIVFKMIPTPNRAQDVKDILEGISHIQEGDLEYVVKTKSKGVYEEIAKGLNGITDGLKTAVEDGIKSERLKTELISNVSHDIRTPLTSIITYIDLLKKEGLNQKDSSKYMDILEQKAHRLKNLTDDLFEASKASSGNIPVELEKVDVMALLSQVMGELNEKIHDSGLDFKWQNDQEKVWVQGDGKLLWRVVENLMSNIFKYALKNSRVYMEITKTEDKVCIIFKNISSYPLNIDAQELMQRFTRGDESRNSEGSGLGLSIAKSLVELQNGVFNIKIDGDLFKTIIEMPRSK